MSGLIIVLEISLRGGGVKIYEHSSSEKIEYIHFLDSDDWFERRCIEECVENILVSGAEIVWHSHFIFDEIENKTSSNQFFALCHLECGRQYSGIEIFSQLPSPSFSWAWSGMIGCRNLEKLRFVQGIESEDALFGMQLFALAKKIFIDCQELMHYRIRPNSISHHTLKDKKSKNQAKFPTYLQDVVESFQTDYDVRHYSFAYSHCIICIEMDKFLQRHSKELDDEMKKILVKMIEHRAIFAFGGCGFLSDPRNCREMCKKITQYSRLARLGSKIAFYFPKLYRLLKAIKKTCKK